MDFLVWASFAMISAANIVTPGPAILNTIRRAAQLGVKGTMPTIFGNALGLVVAGSFCAGGVAAFVLASEILWTLFRWLGVVYLAWLGLKLIWIKEELDLGENGVDRPHIPNKVLFFEAFTLAATNPKAILFFVAIFPQVMDTSRPIWLQSTIMIATFCTISIASLLSYSGIAAFLRTRFLTQTRYRTFRVTSGFLLLVFAGKLAREVK
ncbi:LysE family translocator [Cohaesibacter gelatinilyticus]|uniref:Threonine/homoserine/homoserine lactone efflux protein n=1 Tax=Cohaesibacter gelatinilyticus TaxID=372072 RepID=A0A285N9L6_9HYPH|nr:LysE family translocator [Cohaesibacter gelatinilyticus]SNZ05607.1 Threonine/homoserine/homoserine lactone efflux protein [Cohaesibacter gelatinilyticus]HAT87780.1 LysE family translocator [Hyphomicrobiales bacterium]